MAFRSIFSRGILTRMSIPNAKRTCSHSKDSLGIVKRFAVEGNIAAGKTTFLELLKEAHPKYHIVSEPLVRWQNVPEEEDEAGTSAMTNSQRHGSNLLEMFYDDPKRWGYTFQTYACISRLRMQMKDIPPDHMTPPVTIEIMERSVYSDNYCFARNLRNTGTLSQIEWSLYNDWHGFLLDTLPVSLDGFIYLRVDPELCLQRLHKRSRDEERDVSLDYLISLHERHDQWLKHKSIKVHKGIENSPVLVLESYPDLLDPRNKEERSRLFEKVHDFVTST